MGIKIFLTCRKNYEMLTVRTKRIFYKGKCNIRVVNDSL